MLQFLADGKCSRWNDLWSHCYFYDEQCTGCKFIVTIGHRHFCSKTQGGRIGLHQVIRSQIGCTGCENYCRKLDSEICLRCLDEHLDTEPFEMMEVKRREKNVLQSKQ